MGILSITLIVLSAVVMSSGIGRIVFRWRYDVIVAASLFVTFAVDAIALLALLSLGVLGVFLTVATAILATFTYVYFNFKNIMGERQYPEVWGLIYWMVFLIIFSIAGLKSWNIAAHVNEMYSLNSQLNSFNLVFTLFVLAGGLSILMIIREKGG